MDLEDDLQLKVFPGQGRHAAIPVRTRSRPVPVGRQMKMQSFNVRVKRSGGFERMVGPLTHNFEVASIISEVFPMVRLTQKACQK